MESQRDYLKRRALEEEDAAVRAASDKARELHEELGIDVAASCLAPLTFASHRYDAFHLLMPLYVCRRWNGIPAPLEGQALKWVAPSRLREFEMPPADVPLVAALTELL